MKVSHGRRNLLLGGAGLAAAPWSLQAREDAPSGPTLLGGQELERARSSQVRAFDAHSHFFNADDVPVAGYALRSHLHDFNPAVRAIAAVLLPFVQVLAQSAALSPRSEMALLDAWRKNSKGRTPAEVDAELDRAIEQSQKDIAQQLYGELRRDPVAISEINRALSLASQDKSSGALRTPSSFSLEFVERSVRFGAARGGETGSEKSLSAAPLVSLTKSQSSAARVMGFLEFLGHMLSLRHHNLRIFIKRSAKGSPDVPLSGAAGALVDFTYWLGAPENTSRLQDQMLLHEQLSLLSGGFLLPLIAYNPWGDVKDPTNKPSLALVKEAVEKHGFVGVKIYPPMGFFPYNNTSLKVETRLPRPDLNALDNALADFFRLCADLNVPVLAHTNATEGRDLAHDQVPRAEGWEQLKDVPGLSKVTVQAGHFGGANVHGQDKADWSKQYAALMAGEGPDTKYRMFADIGYWSELLEPESGARTKLKSMLQEAAPPSKGAALTQRLMYGSDWFMMSQVPGWESFPQRVAALLRQIDGTGAIARRVLGDNFLDCYGLSAAASRADGKSNYDRLKAYWRDTDQRGPAWLS